MKKFLAVLFAVTVILALSACGNNPADKSSVDASADDTLSDAAVAVNSSPDKYTWYIKNYVGKNCASIGYTSMGGKRMDTYGEGLIELVFVSADGSYIDVESDDALKEYSVVKQNIEPNTELKLVFEKDDDGEEYDSLVESQSFEEIVLCVKKIGSSDKDIADPTAIKPSPDKYTRYISDYKGRNLANCGYTSMSGELMDEYADAYVKLVIVAEDGTFIDPEDTESLKNYVVTGQSVAPNTELKLVFDKDSDGEEYDLVESQNIEEVELNVKKLTSETQSNSKVTKKATTNTTSEKTKDLVDGMRPEFKAAMDSYETFINGYVDFMKKYSDNPDDLSLLAEYSTYMDKYDDMVENFDEWEDEDMNDDETAYYIDVHARVSKKLLEVTE